MTMAMAMAMAMEMEMGAISPFPSFPKLQPSPARTQSASITLPALPPSSAASDLPSVSTGYAAAAPRASHHHLTIIIAILSVFVTFAAIALLWLFVLLIRRQKRQIRLLGDCPQLKTTASKLHEVGFVAAGRRWSSNAGAALAHSPINPLRRWLRDSKWAFRRYAYSEIEKATDDFSSVIGKGGFGTVYKARFDGGSVAAVKRMDGVSHHRDKEFCKEMEFLARLHHRHLLLLLGFCITPTQRFLVYEFMENGSLSEHLQGDNKSPLAWQTRIQIAIDVAAALEYLHYFSDPPLCHRDIKSSNILLDANFVAKVADFGLAHPTPSYGKSGVDDEMSTNVRGTPGYLDPEYVVTQQLTAKSDIYSYGVVLLELVTGRGAVQNKCNLVAWAQPYLQLLMSIPEHEINRCAELMDLDSMLLAMADPALLPQFRSSRNLKSQLRSMARLITMCTSASSHSRPNIRQVLAFLYTRFDNPNLTLTCSSPSLSQNE